MPRGRVVGIDLLEIEPMPGVDFVTLDFLDPTAPVSSPRCWGDLPTS